jgi:hypothetical protein
VQLQVSVCDETVGLLADCTQSYDEGQDATMSEFCNVSVCITGQFTEEEVENNR